jgi:UDP-glucuronate 4-epimerase
MHIIVTGAAGFIGFHLCQALLKRGETVIGIDNLNSYYDVALKQARLGLLQKSRHFTFLPVSISDWNALREGVDGVGTAGKDVSVIVHLAAQAGVRYSLSHPFAYSDANVTGHLSILELARTLPGLKHLIYASSSSVYGDNSKVPFHESDPVDHPVSLYAATKRAAELMSETYAHLYGLPQTGLRFFTVYGPWGRPDMAYWVFTEAILKGRPVQLFNHGRLARDFTYIDDVVPALLALIDHGPPVTESPHRILNVGSNRPEKLPHFVDVIEKATGRKAVQEFLPMQAGDVKETYADIGALRKAIGFAPTTPLEEGIPRFVDWYRNHYGI